MPEISRFLGIVIYMYWSEHNPPHFHAVYKLLGGIVRGECPKRALPAVLDWLDLHQAELLGNWQRAQLDKPLNSIEPLE
ncbi:MAG: DUF4160 domain-containing protein [Methylobacter sp.]